MSTKIAKKDLLPYRLNRFDNISTFISDNMIHYDKGPLLNLILFKWEKSSKSKMPEKKSKSPK